jgi:hypothetical protein
MPNRPHVLQPDYKGKKRCRLCTKVKPRVEFAWAKLNIDGLSLRCKRCISIRCKRWRDANVERVRQNNRDYNVTNAERHRARAKEWNEQNPERTRQRCSFWYRANKQYAGDAAREWRKANPDQVKVNRVKDKAKRRKAEAANGGCLTAGEWRALLIKFESRCVCCGIKPAKLTADHVIPVLRGGSNFIENIQPLCGPCNSSKGAHHATDYRDTPFTRTGKTAQAA